MRVVFLEFCIQKTYPKLFKKGEKLTFSKQYGNIILTIQNICTILRWQVITREGKGFISYRLA